MAAPRLDDTESRLHKIIINYQKLCPDGNFNSFLKTKFPSSEVWRFFIDGTRQNEGFNWLLPVHEELDNLLQKKNIPFSFLNSKLVDLKTGVYKKDPIRNFITDNHIKNLEILEKETTNKDLTLKEIGLRKVGWLPFEETEPGYLTALVQTFHELIQLNIKLDTNNIIAVHAKATFNVNNLIYSIRKKQNDPRFLIEKKGCYRISNAAGTSIYGENLTIDGLTELLNKIEQGSNQYPNYLLTIESFDEKIHIDRFTIAQYKMQFKCKNNAEFSNFFYKTYIQSQEAQLISRILSEDTHEVQHIVTGVMSELIKKYESEIAVPKKPIDKLRCIITFIRDCEQLHPFIDGNTRTFSMLLCGYLMMKNGFPFPIWENPNRFIGFSIEELLLEAIKGAENTLAIANGKKDLYGITTDQILSVATPVEKIIAERLDIFSSSSSASTTLKSRR